MSTQLTLFGLPAPSPETAVSSKPGQPLRVRDKYRLAQAKGQDLIRFDARPHEQMWYIKIYDAQTGGWCAYGKFTVETYAKSTFQELLDSGNYAEG